MPGLSTIAEDKKTTEIPIVLTEVMSPAPASKSRNTKKYVIIAVSGILAVAIILTAILVGMYMFTEAQKEIIKYTMQLSDKGTQDVTSDPNENVVQYHVSNPSHDAWIVNDFNKDIQLVKVVREGKTNCYLSPLNRTNAMAPSKITGPDTTDPKEAESLVYRTSATPIADTSFLGKTARDTCKGISVYWLYPSCVDGNINKGSDYNGTNVDHPRTKRQVSSYYWPYYCQNDVVYQSPSDGLYYYVGCITGCCKTVCACNIDFYYYVSGGTIYCSWTTSSCPPTVPDDPVYYDGSCIYPDAARCPYSYHYCPCS